MFIFIQAIVEKVRFENRCFLKKMFITWCFIVDKQLVKRSVNSNIYYDLCKKQRQYDLERGTAETG